MSREKKHRHNSDRHSLPREVTNSIDEDGVLISSRNSSQRWSSDAHDIYAAGTPGGGSSVGGLAGTNIGDAAPGNADIDDALGDDDFERRESYERPLSDREGHVDVADEDID